MEEASGTFTNSKTRSGHLFSISCAEGKRIDGKTVGKLYKYPEGTMLYPQQNAAITNRRRMAVSVLINTMFEAAQIRKRRKK
jgi:hypothetical protein